MKKRSLILSCGAFFLGALILPLSCLANTGSISPTSYTSDSDTVTWATSGGNGICVWYPDETFDTVIAGSGNDGAGPTSGSGSFSSIFGSGINGTYHSMLWNRDCTQTWRGISPVSSSYSTWASTNGDVSNFVADFTFTGGTCSPSTISNGTIGSYPTCAITCNTGYTLSDGACVLADTVASSSSFSFLCGNSTSTICVEDPSLSLGIAILIGLVFIAFIAMIWNNFRANKKPKWQR